MEISVARLPEGGRYGSPRASMEPLLFRNGNHLAWKSFRAVSARLQWSHFFSEMEIKLVYLEPLDLANKLASMEPLLFRNGNAPIAAGQHVTVTNLAELQWSHFFSEMEILDKRYIYLVLILRLQWSHFFSEMEM